ncbi:unnamed protein product, partial [Symbiodinium microadriaticum]
DSDGDYDMVPERLVLDCGGVLSVPSSSGKEKYDGNDIYKAAIPGAYAFCQKFMHTYGADSLQVISRVNFPESKNHWVVRFCSSLGIDERQVHLVSERRDKGPKARSLGCSVAVDDQCACLYSICVHCYDILDSVKPLILFNESGYRRSGAKWDDYVQERVTRTTSWLTVATMCGVNTDGWEELGKLGPPHCWHQQATVKRWFLMMAPAAPKSKASAASAGPAEKKPAASAEPAEKKPAASAEPAEKKPAASAEPAERKEHDEPAASAEQERDTSAAPAENDTSSAVSAEEKKEKEKHKKIQQEKKTSSHDENYSYSYYSEEEVEDDDHKEEEEESSSSLSVHVVDADNPPPVPQQAKTKSCSTGPAGTPGELNPLHEMQRKRARAEAYRATGTNLELTVQEAYAANVDMPPKKNPKEKAKAKAKSIAAATTMADSARADNSQSNQCAEHLLRVHEVQEIQRLYLPPMDPPIKDFTYEVVDIDQWFSVIASVVERHSELHCPRHFVHALNEHFRGDQSSRSHESEREAFLVDSVREWTKQRMSDTEFGRPILYLPYVVAHDLARDNACPEVRAEERARDQQSCEGWTKLASLVRAQPFEMFEAADHLESMAEGAWAFFYVLAEAWALPYVLAEAWTLPYVLAEAQSSLLTLKWTPE